MVRFNLENTYLKWNINILCIGKSPLKQKCIYSVWLQSVEKRSGQKLKREKIIFIKKDLQIVSSCGICSKPLNLRNRGGLIGMLSQQ